MSVFGEFIHAGEVEQAVKDTLQTWFETYLGEMERQTGREPGSLPLPRSYQIVSESADPARWPEDQLPSIIILAPGFAEAPEHDGTGAFKVRYQVSVAAMVSARDQGATRQLSRLYGTVISAILVQQPSLGDFSCGLQWVSETFDDIPVETSRSLACAIEGFHVDVDHVLSTAAGPTGPANFPRGEESNWGLVQETIVETRALED